MSRRANATTTGLSLFPFLDVLICTMGSLILLLIVITKKVQPAIAEKVRQAAMTTAIEPPRSNSSAENSPVVAESDSVPDDDSPDDDSLNLWRTQIESLAAERDDARDQLDGLERRLVAAQSAMLRTQQQAATKQERLKAARGTQQQAETDCERLQSEVAAMRGELLAAEQRLTEAKERHRTAKSKFAFVPFDGRTGTTRRPILIECTDQFIRFVPEDVRLTPAELNGFTSGFNPLLIASRELIHYWNAYDRMYADEADASASADASQDSLNKDSLNNGTPGKEPYVLLLVRPTGAVSFHIAKGLLTQLKIPHGYELLDDDMELELAEPSRDAKKICQQAIAQTLAEREKVLQVLAGKRELQAEQLQLEPDSRTFVPVEPTTGSLKPTSRERTPNASLAARPMPAGNSTGNSAATRLSGATNTPRSAAATGRDEPPEEPLPQQLARRYENDDSKPFPLRRADRTTSTSTATESAANRVTNGSSGESASGSARRSGSPAAANPGMSSQRVTSGNDPRHHKRRYSMPRAGIGIEKAISIRVWRNRILVGDEFVIPVETGVRTESLVERVLIAMDHVQTGWPSAGEGFHWVPTLRYEVVPGGDQVQQRLNSALFDLGLVSSVTYLDADPNKVSPRETPRSRAAIAPPPLSGSLAPSGRGLGRDVEEGRTRDNANGVGTKANGGAR